MSYGLTIDGYIPKTYEVLVEEVSEAVRNEFGVTPSGILKKLIEIFCERLAELWELGEAIVASQDTTKAVGAFLDALCSLTGTLRNPATASGVTLTMTGTAATPIPAGSRAKNVTTETEWITIEDATLVALTAWLGNTAYTVGQRRANGGNSYICITAGTSAATGGPTTEAEDITDGTVHWRFMGNGVAAADALAGSADTGPVVGTSGDITEIVTPIGGWESVINLLDANLGAVVETDEDLRVRRDDEVAAPGTSPVPAIRAALLEIAGVTSVTVFYNNTDLVDGDGMPPHSVEALVRGGDDQDIWDALFENVAGGILTHGTETGTVTDSEGTDHTLKFSRPDPVAIYVAITLTKDPDTYPEDGDDQVKDAIVAFGDAQKCGKDAVVSSVLAQAFQVDGVLDVTACYIDDVAIVGTPTATIPISLRQLAEFDTSRISVTSSNGVP